MAEIFILEFDGLTEETTTGRPKRAEWSKARAHHHPPKPSGKAKHSAS